MSEKPVIFIVEDDPIFNKLLTAYFTNKGLWEVHSFEDGESSLNSLHLKPIIYLEDFDLPGMNGLEVMKHVKKVSPSTEFIFLSGQSDLKVAVEILKEGAFDYVMKDSNAKQSALNKIDQIMKIKKLEIDKKYSRFGFYVFTVILLISWFLFWLLSR
jgi:DNA-binding NtrC family response regulator